MLSTQLRHFYLNINLKQCSSELSLFKNQVPLLVEKMAKNDPNSWTEETKKINWLYKHLNNESKKTNPKPCFGVIAMDFPGLDLIKKITEFN